MTANLELDSEVTVKIKPKIECEVKGIEITFYGEIDFELVTPANSEFTLFLTKEDCKKLIKAIKDLK